MFNRQSDQHDLATRIKGTLLKEGKERCTSTVWSDSNLQSTMCAFDFNRHQE